MGSQPGQMAYPNPIDASFDDKLDADFVAYYNRFMAIHAATHGVTIQDMRATPKKFASPWCNDFSYEPFVRDVRLSADDGHEFAVRCYHPDERTSPFGKGPYPVYINFHGGGYTFGDLSGDAELCMLIRNRVGILVLDVDYRLCPGMYYTAAMQSKAMLTPWQKTCSSKAMKMHGPPSAGYVPSYNLPPLTSGLQQRRRDQRPPRFHFHRWHFCRRPHQCRLSATCARYRPATETRCVLQTPIPSHRSTRADVS